jgi:uncharacterized protein YecT (DUF1311 family)
LDRAPPDASRTQPTRSGPSFDCRTSATSMERAICGDPTLSEWDLRMGQQYQQVLRLKKPAEAQALQESQRSWIQQRNSSCGALPGNAVWSCILDMTKKRIEVQSAELARMSQTTVTSQSSDSQTRPTVTAPAQPSVTPTSALVPTPQPNAVDGGPNILLVILFILGAVVGAIVIFNNIQRREKAAAELRRLAAERQRLVDRYGEAIADRIIAKKIWQGMTEDQLVESWGAPADRDYEVKHTKTKETWKYGQTGRNRFSSRVFLENGFVVGWKQ